MVRGDEAAVVAAFAAWLRDGGWSVRTEVESADVVAERDGARLICEAKGRTSDPGTDLDTAYGQLLPISNARGLSALSRRRRPHG